MSKKKLNKSNKWEHERGGRKRYTGQLSEIENTPTFINLNMKSRSKGKIVESQKLKINNFLIER